MDITIWFNSSLRFFFFSTTLFSNTFFTRRIYLMRRFCFNYTMYEVLVFLSIGLRGRLGLNSFYSLRDWNNLEMATFSFRLISPYRSVLAQINNHRFWCQCDAGISADGRPTLSVRMVWTTQWSDMRDTTQRGHLVMRYWYHLDWLLLAVRGGLDLVTVLLGAVALETIFGVFIFILILWTFLCMGDLNLSESMACTIE